MRLVVKISLIAAFSLPVAGFAADEAQPLLLQAETRDHIALSETAPVPSATVSGASAIPDAIAGLIADAQAGNGKAQVELGVKYANAEGVPKDQPKANRLFCGAAKYGDVEGLYNLGWAYANARGVTRDDAVAARLFALAAARGHPHATRLLAMMPANSEAQLPACMQPELLPIAKALPPAGREWAFEHADVQIPMAPKEVQQLVQRLAPQYEVDSNLALALIWAESAFNASALSPARAQGLMQLIPETAERFGVKRPFNPDENVKGGLAYLRWLLAYFQGDVPLVLAAYNAGEGAVEKHRGIPPYNETRDYVKKITGIYRRLTHPYNASIVKPSPIIEQLKRSM